MVEAQAALVDRLLETLTEWLPEMNDRAGASERGTDIIGLEDLMTPAHRGGFCRGGEPGGPRSAAATGTVHSYARSPRRGVRRCTQLKPPAAAIALTLDALRTVHHRSRRVAAGRKGRGDR